MSPSPAFGLRLFTKYDLKPNSDAPINWAKPDGPKNLAHQSILPSILTNFQALSKGPNMKSINPDLFFKIPKNPEPKG
jgi:hypothetical protein